MRDLYVPLAGRVGGVDDVEEETRGLGLVERRAEGAHEAVRQVLDEAHGVRDQDGRRDGRLQTSDRRVERREEFVLHEHACCPTTGVDEILSQWA